MSAASQETHRQAMATRRVPWFVIGCAAVVALIGALLVYEIWMHASIAKITPIRVQRISIVKLRCSPEHFWGQLIVYKRLTDDYEREGVLCRDWKAGSWILQDPLLRL